MRSIDVLMTVIGNLSRSKLRSTLTAFGITIGTAAVIILVSLGVGMQQSISKSMLSTFGEVKQIIVFPAMFGGGGSPFSGTQKGKKLDEKLIKKIKRWSGVESVSGSVDLPPSEIKYHSYKASIAPIGFDVKNPGNVKIKAGHLPRFNQAKAVVLGNKLEENLFRSYMEKHGRLPEHLLGKRIYLTLTRTNEDGTEEKKRVGLRVAGIAQSQSFGSDYQTVFIPSGLVLKLMSWQSFTPSYLRRYGYERLVVTASSVDKVDAVEKKLDKLKLGYFSMKDQLASMQNFFRVLQFILGAIGGVALLVASLGIINTMIMSIYERTREIGIMKAVGASNNDIIKIFLAESGTIGLLGGVLGIALGWLAAVLIGFLANSYLRQAGASPEDASVLSFVVPAWLAIFSLFFSTAVGVIAGIYPALRAAKLNPLTALRHE